MSLPQDYAERVYAGVLGKLIGVYLGRPFEGWSYDRIIAELGEINYYVNERLGHPLIVTDDDITGTFTFLRALPDYGNSPNLTAEQIGQTWLNYLIEKRTILWWGGVGNSTEHTAYQRLKSGIKAPASGSIAVNGKTVAEQIGAQIFIDGWAMVAPGDPELAADLARRAGSVSHDGEALYGAQVIAAMEAQAFVESDLGRLFDTATALIPANSTIFRVIAELRDLRTKEKDWRAARAWLEAHYGYQHYEGVCHMVPNHGLIALSLLYGDDDFQKTLMICNTSGWDTDCNSGNVGCLMGIKNGLGGIDAGPDWRGPVADRLYMPTADGGRAITDAVTETYHIVNIGRALHGQPPAAPKDGARYHFELPGSVQGFMPEDSIEVRDTVMVENVEGHSQSGRRSLAIHYNKLAPGRTARIKTATFAPADAANLGIYELVASPSVYPGQEIHACLQADPANAEPVLCRLYVSLYEPASGVKISVGPEALEAMARMRDDLVILYGPEIELAPGMTHEFAWLIPDTGCRPIAEVGIEIKPVVGFVPSGSVYMDYLTWEGTPTVRLGKPANGGVMWSKAWAQGVDAWWAWWPFNTFRIMHNEGTGLLIQGTRDWHHYSVSTRLNPHLTASAGIAAYVQGMRRYYALVLRPGNKVCIVKALDGEAILTETDFVWEFDGVYDLKLEVVGTRLRGWVDGQLILEAEDTDRPLEGGAVALLCDSGCIESGDVIVEAV
jgi:ADP-ribosylglycohydrolase